MQLEKELGRENQSISIIKKTYVLENTSNPTPVIVQKTPGIIERLDDLIERSVSASMLRNYLTCPLDFYYKYLLGFGDAKEVEEDLEAATFGTLIHRTLEILYEPYARIYFENEDGKRVQKERKPQQITSLVIDQLIKNYPVVLESCFKKHFNNNEDAYSRGNNYLAFKIANEMTGRFLKNERQFVMSLSEPMFIEALEFRLEVEKEIEVNGEIKMVRFKGFADRIDRIGDNYRIIDYKSGKVDKSQASFGNAKSSEEIPNYFKSKKFLLQLTQYTWMYKELYGRDVSAGIYSFLDNRTEFIALNFSKLDPKEVVRSFPEKVALILSEMYNSEIPFTHADNYFSYCNYCN